MALVTWERLLFAAFMSFIFGMFLCWVGDQFIGTDRRSGAIVWGFGAFFITAGVILGIAAFSGCDYESKKLVQR